MTCQCTCSTIFFIDLVYFTALLSPHSHPFFTSVISFPLPSLPPFQSNKMTLSPLLTSPSEWLPNKSLVSAISPSPSHPHRLHISTSHSLLLLDLRQPRWPLLDQSHDLSHTPKVGETVFRDFSLLLATSLISVRAVIRLCLSSLSSPDIVHSSESFSLL